jgi:hypothetical protein
MHDPARASVALRLVAILGSLGLLLAGCEANPSSPLPSPSLVYLSFSPLPIETAPATTPAQPTSTLAGSWPPGWDVAFCSMFDNAVAAQQLIVDVERALSDKATKDAKGLASNLNDSAAQATQQIAALPAWEPAGQALSEIGDLMNLGTQAAAKYTRYFKDGTKAALRQARQIRSEDAAAVPQTNSDLARLADSGLVCPKHALQLESP